MSKVKPLRFQVVKGKKRMRLKMDGNLKVSDLKREIEKRTNIPSQFQTLFLKGFGELEDKIELSGYTLKPSSKIKLIGSSLNEVISVSSGSLGMGAILPSNKKEEEPGSPLSPTHKRHETFLKKFKIPERAEKGLKGREVGLKPQIRSILDSYGKVVRFLFKTQEGCVVINSPVDTRTVPFDRIRDVIILPIKQHEGYSILGIKIGRVESSILWFYYVPDQYTKAIKYTLLGNEYFPF